MWKHRVLDQEEDLRKGRYEHLKCKGGLSKDQTASAIPTAFERRVEMKGKGGIEAGSIKS